MELTWFLFGLTLGAGLALCACLWRHSSILRKAGEHLVRSAILHAEIQRIHDYQRDALEAGLEVLARQGRKL